MQNTIAFYGDYYDYMLRAKNLVTYFVEKVSQLAETEGREPLFNYCIYRIKSEESMGKKLRKNN